MLQNNAVHFDDQFIEDVRGAYSPFFDKILYMDTDNPLPFPDEYADIIEKGRELRQSVISLFRGALGVEIKA